MRKKNAMAMITAFLAAAAFGPALAADFQLTSNDIGPDKPLAQDFVFSGFGCGGGNQSPALSWSGAPEGTKSYAVALFDPDAMQGRAPRRCAEMPEKMMHQSCRAAPRRFGTAFGRWGTVALARRPPMNRTAT
jgi:phosphatidylethanolamine-binding protein (PEBP) family uncharacterized protein